MKQMIVFLAMLSLGCFLFRLAVGDDNSVYTGVKDLWQQEVAREGVL